MAEESNTRGGILSVPLRLPRITLAAVVVLSVALGSLARSLTFDGSPEKLLPRDDPERVYFERVGREFGAGENIVIGVFADDVFSPATLAKIDDLTARLWRLDGVSTVVGPTALLRIEAKDGLHRAPLMRQLPRTAAEAAAFREAVLAHPLARRSVISADGRAAAIIVQWNAKNRDTASRQIIDRRVRELIDELRGPETFAVAGPPAFTAQVTGLLERDLLTLTPAALVLISAVALLALRSFRGGLLSLLAVLISVTWTLGLMVLTGHAITMGTVIVPPLLALIGIGYPLHIIARYDREVRPDRRSPEIVAATVSGVGLPLAIATLMTLVSVSLFLFSSIPALHDFGLYAAIGVATTLVVSLTLVPSALVLLPRPQRGAAESFPLTRLLEQLGAQTSKRRNVLIFLGLLVTVIGALGVARLGVETQPLLLLDPNSSVATDRERIATHVSGTHVIDVVVDGGTPGSIKQIDTLRALEELQSFVDRQPGVSSTVSLLDYLYLVRDALQPGASGRVLPETQPEIDALLNLDPAHLHEVMNEDFSSTRLIVRSTLSGSAEVATLLNRVQAFASPKLLHVGRRKHAIFPRGMIVHLTGPATLMNRASAVLSTELSTVMWRASVALLAVSSLLFLSLRMGLFSLLLNVPAVIVLFGVMGWTGASLNVVTACLGPVVLGIAVGHTVQYLSACRAVDGGEDQPAPVLGKAVESASRAIGFSALALMAGFLLYIGSGFSAVRSFGYLGSATMGVAFVANLLLLSSRALTTRIFTISDLLFMKLAPQQIQLFDGLRPFQAKIAVLTGRLAKAAPGAYITRRGEMSGELYVLLSGRAEVRSGDGGQIIGSLARGDVIGEMGLVREQPRSADVIAVEETEYFVLDGGFLERLKRQYPRIAASVFLNLTRILSDRLDRTTAKLAEISAGRQADGRAEDQR